MSTIKYFGKIESPFDLIPKRYIFNTVTPEYDATKTYALEDLVMHDEYMYKCTTAITTAEVWTPAHWTQIKVADLVKGSGALIITGTLATSTKYGSFTVDKTPADVMAAFTAKKPVLLTLDARNVDPQHTIFNAFVSRTDPDTGGYMCYGACVWGETYFSFTLDTSDGTAYDLCTCGVTPLAVPDEETIVLDDADHLSTAVGGWREEVTTQHLVFKAEAHVGPTTGTTYDYWMSGATHDIPEFTSTMSFEFAGKIGGVTVDGDYDFDETASGSKIYTYRFEDAHATVTLDFNQGTDGKATIVLDSASGSNNDLTCNTSAETTYNYHKIDGHYLPIDNETIQYSSTDNKIYVEELSDADVQSIWNEIFV